MGELAVVRSASARRRLQAGHAGNNRHGGPLAPAARLSEQSIGADLAGVEELPCVPVCACTRARTSMRPAASALLSPRCYCGACLSGEVPGEPSENLAHWYRDRCRNCILGPQPEPARLVDAGWNRHEDE